MQPVGHLPGNSNVLRGNSAGQDQMDVLHRRFPQTDGAAGLILAYGCAGHQLLRDCLQELVPLSAAIGI